MLVVIANYQGLPELATHDWESLIFGATDPSLVNYFREVSNGRFTWSSAGLLWANFTQAERATQNTRTQIVEAALTQNPGYRVLDSMISLMGPTIASDSNRTTYHLDPWHKLALGWSDPRIVSLRDNARAVLPPYLDQTG